jgi:hypothetical protein
MSVNPGTSQAQEDNRALIVILFSNLIILAALVLIFRYIVSWKCVSPDGIGLSLGLAVLALIHLGWRYLDITPLKLGISIGPLEIRIERIGPLIERLHPRMLRDHVLWVIALLLLLISAVLGFPALSPFRNQDQIPMFEYFLVRTNDNTARYHQSDTLQIARDSEVVHLEAEISGQSDISCTWSAVTGTVLQPKGCETQYDFPSPDEEIPDIVTVEVSSPCEGYRAANLTIQIVGTGP